MNNVHRHLSFPVNLIDAHSVYLLNLIQKHNKEFDPIKHGHYRFPLEEIPAEFIDWFNATFADIYIKDWEVFYTPAGNVLPIHSDGFQPFVDFVKLNFVYDGDRSTMHWFKLKEELELTSDTNHNKTSYTFIKPEDVDEIYKAEIGTPSLVNVGVPHGIDNKQNTNGRWCICLIPNYRDSSNRESPRVLFNEALDIFKGYIQ